MAEEKKDTAPEAEEGHIVQARNELANGERLGDEAAVEAAIQRLEAAGVDPDSPDPRYADAAAKRSAAAGGDVGKAPEQRATPADVKSTTKGGK